MVVFEVRRELPHGRTHLLAQVEYAGGKPIGERLLDLAQPPDMRDVSRSLERKHEIRGRLYIPLGIAFGPLQGIERAVDFDDRQYFRCKLQFGALRQCPGIKSAAPRFIAPAGNADPNTR